MDQFTDPAVIIGLLTALGVGTIIQQLLNRRKSRVDVDVSLTAMAREVAAELRQDNQELRDQLDRVESEIRQIRGLVIREQTWAHLNGHLDAPVLQPVKGI